MSIKQSVAGSLKEIWISNKDRIDGELMANGDE